MYRELLESNQPVVYRTIGNALRRNRLSHCYLFSGQKGTLTREAAILLAQSIICSYTVDGFACEQCSDCRRIAEGSYADVIYVDGSDSSIKNDDVYDIQRRFYRTALEQAGKKIFIINDCENMTGKASNSLLKFIEEPTNNTYGIFITSQLSRVLPTIISRCQVINFRPMSKEAFRSKALETGLDELSAHLVSQMVRSSDEIGVLSSDKSWQSAVRIFAEFMNHYFSNPKNAMIYLQENGFRDSGKNPDRNCFRMFLEIAVIFVNDYHGNIRIDDETWDGLLEKAGQSGFDSQKYLLAVSQTRDALEKQANLPLLTDQMLYKMIGGV